MTKKLPDPDSPVSLEFEMHDPGDPSVGIPSVVSSGITLTVPFWMVEDPDSRKALEQEMKTVLLGWVDNSAATVLTKAEAERLAREDSDGNGYNLA